jgi:O-antigen ligase
MQHLLVAFLMLVGWLNSSHFPPWVSWHSELPFFVASMFAAISIAWRNGFRKTMAFPAAAALPLFLALILALQAVRGFFEWTGQALVVSLYLLFVLTAITWGWREAATAQSSPTVRPGEWLAGALIAGAILSMGLALAQTLQVGDALSFVAPMTSARRPGGNLAQPNHLATLLVMGLAGALYLNALRRMSDVTYVLLMLFLAFGVAVTESRSGLLSLLTLSVFAAWKHGSMPAHRARRLAWMTGAASIGLFLIWPDLFRYYYHGIDEGASALERLASSGGDARMVMWRQMLDASLQRPWLGWGIRDTAEAHNAVAHELVGTLPFTYSHNVVIDLLVWIGWPLTITILASICLWMWRRLDAACREPFGWFGMALLIPFTVHSLLEFPFAYAYLLFPAMFAVGLIEYAARGGTAVIRLPGWVAMPVVVVLAIGGAWSIVDYLRVEDDFRIARFQLLRIGSPHIEPSPRILLLNQLEEMVASTRIPLMRAMATEQLDLLRRAALHNPWSGSQYRYATALAFNGQYAEARRQMLVIRAQHGTKTFQTLNAQLEQDLKKRALPPLNVDAEMALIRVR